MVTDSRALVLSGGGVTGIAWCIGLLHGLQLADVDVTTADLIVGTSAGATVGAQIAGGTALSTLVGLQETSVEASGEIAVEPDFDAYITRLGEALDGATDPTDIRARIGSVALETDTVAESARREVISQRLPVQRWTDRTLRLVAVDTASGDWLTFDRDSGVPLVDAVAASCAVPGVWPPVTIDGHRYMDGGARSLTNADVAAGHDRVLVIALRPMMDQDLKRLDEEIGSLEPDTQSLLIQVDEPSRLAMGPNPLDPARRSESVRAGIMQASGEADRVQRFWD
jgi:NTE family protein